MDEEGQHIDQSNPRELGAAQSVQQFAHGPLPFQTHSPSMQQQLLLALVQENAATVLALQHAAASGMTHNLIPHHLQEASLAYSLNGTPGHQPALILPGNMTPSLPSSMQQVAPMSVLTVQDRLMIPPVYNGVNLNYPGLHMIHAAPPIYVVENFLTPYECEFLVTAASDSWSPAPVVGKGAGEISSSRTSSTCYLAREDLPDYMRKVSLLTGKPVEHCELPQVGRYLHTQQYLQVSWHF